MRQIIIKPLLTEKSLSQTAGNWYAFVVATQARKGTIAQAVAHLYKVKVVDVRTSRMSGKTRRAGRRQMVVAKPDWKKALVRLAVGQKIDAFEVSGEQPKKNS